MAPAVSIFFRPYQIPSGEPLGACVDVARAMDEAGIHSVIFGDHLLIGSHPENYPYGNFAHTQQSAWPEPLITLGAMAAATKRLMLATGVLLSPLRSPVLLAKSIATLDALSNGRTQLALGVGWQKEEYEALGVPWDERYKRLDEGVRACRAFWGEQPVSHRSETISVDGAWMLPRPVQARVPLLYGVAMTPRQARRIAELGDGWFPMARTPGEVRDGVEVLSQALAAVGRDIADQHIRVGLPPKLGAADVVDVPATLAAIPEYRAAGATIFQIAAPSHPESMGELYRFIDRVARTAQDYDA